MAGWDELTAREEAVLAAVGRRLTNREIAEQFHISVRTVESHVAALRRKLDVNSRAGLVEASGARRSLAIPVPRNSFVGRQRDLVAVEDLLHRGRWVTVVGPAGSGKTRLALELATRNPRVPVVVDLAYATERDVGRVLARTVGVGADSGADVVATASVVLSSADHLLVLDNCDRVTQVACRVVARLLALAGSVSVVATSRSPLGGSDEAVYPLPPLPTGDTDAAAVHLFLDRAAASAPGSRISPADAGVVAQVCRRLDGLPLAIELAAARMRHLSLPELAQRLEDGFGSLDRGSIQDRHRTLETAFAWTWDLLDDEERAVLTRLAALPRAFDLDLARVVAGRGADETTLRLLDRSLVSTAPGAGNPTQFRLLESLRAFVLDRTAPVLVQEVRDLHAGYVADVAGWLSGKARVDDSPAAMDAADRVCPQVNAAVAWSVAEGRTHALSLVRSLSVGVEQYGPDIDSLDALARAARDPRIRSATTVTDLLNLGSALSYVDLELVDDVARLALERAEDDESVLAARHLAGFADAYQDRGESALAHLAVAERLAVELGDTWQLAHIRQARGIALRGPSLDDPAAAMAEFESAMSAYALAGDAMHVNNCRYMMAATAVQAGVRTEQALAWVEQCVNYARGTGNRHELAHAVLTRCALLDDPSAEDLLEVADTFRAVGDLRCLARSHLALAELRPPAERVRVLRAALDVARTAHDSGHQVTALERLVLAHWEAGQRHAAAVTLGELSTLVDEPLAMERCPAGLRDHLAEWAAAIAEGRARAAV